MLLFVAVFAQGGLPVGGRWGLWKMGLEPAVILYILAIYPPLHRRWTLAIDALRPLTERPEARRAGPCSQQARRVDSRCCSAPPSPFGSPRGNSTGRWLLLYVFASNIVMFSLMALAIYDCLVRTRRLTRIVRSGLQLDLFDRRSFTPLTRWGQSVSLTFVGGTCLSLLFQSYETLYTVQSLVIYSIMIGVSLTLFFTSIWSIHDALVAAQQRELAVVHQHWSGPAAS